MNLVIKGGCPICSGDKCGDLDGIIHCWRENRDVNSNYHYVGESSTGNGVYIEESKYEKWLDDHGFYRSEYGYLLKRKQTERHRALTKQALHQNEQLSLPPIQMENAVNHLIKTRNLAEDHQSFLLDRGLTLEQIKKYGFFTLNKYEKVPPATPGANKKNCYFSGYGFATPTKTPHGRNLSFQMRGVHSYFWANYDKLSSSKYRMKNKAELPLNAVIEDPDGLSAKTLYLCEGILKPIIAGTRHKINVIGASGGFFFSSPNFFAEYIRLFPKLEKIIFLPDAGSSINQPVLLRISKVATLVKEHGFLLHYLDWNQLFNKDRGDCDEIDPLSFDLAEVDSIDRMPYKLFWDKKGIVNNKLDWIRFIENIPLNLTKNKREINYQKLFKTKTSRWDKLAPRRAFDKEVFVFASEDFKEVLQEIKASGFKYILLSSPTGSGKSYAIGSLLPQDLGYDYIHYLTQQHRYPTNYLLEKNYVPFPAKNKELYHSGKLTPLGHPVLVRDPPFDGARSEPGNCHKAREQLEFYNLQIEKNVCQDCQFLPLCVKEESPGEYGYYYQSQEAWEAPRLRINPQSLDVSKIPESALAVVDEYNQTLNFVETWEITLTDLLVEEDNLKNLLGIRFNSLDFLYDYLTNDVSQHKFGLSSTDYFKTHGKNNDLLHLVPRIKKWEIQRNHEALSSGELPYREWLAILVKAISGDDLRSSFIIQKDKITIVLKNHQLKEVLDAYEQIIFMDATSSKSQLALQLGVEETEIVEIKHESRPNPNLLIQQIGELGNCTKNRSDELKNRITEVKTQFRNLYQDSVGFIDWKIHTELGDLTHFVDSRGSNLFQEKEVVVSFGIANTNMGAAKAEFEVLLGKQIDLNNPDFKRYYSKLALAELIQEIGRLRANRRQDKPLIFYLFSNQKLQGLKETYLYQKSHKIDLHSNFLLQTKLTNLMQLSNKNESAESFSIVGKGDWFTIQLHFLNSLLSTPNALKLFL